MKRAKWLRSAFTGVFIASAGLCYTLLAPKENSSVEIIRGEASEVIAIGYTPTPAPTASPKPTTSASNTPTPTTRVERKRININTATQEELMSLSGIGELRAKCIIAYRNKNGDFKTIEEIMLVGGIKQGIFSKIKDRICTGYEKQEAGP